MMIKRYTLNLSLLFLFSLNLMGQEHLTGLPFNSRVHDAAKKAVKRTEAASPILLPFLDDFSGREVFPASTRWLDKDVFINETFSPFPVTLGVATFDALNDTGALYPEASSFPFLADQLTSRFIDISSHSPADSLYFSFSYQPQGYGNAPEEQDSLVLEFLEQYRGDTLIDTTVVPYDTLFIDFWKPMWSSKGMALDTFKTLNGGRWFRQVMIPLTDQVWYRNDFQFRFYNYASLASTNIPSWRSNADQWNIDHVYLNSGRTLADTLFNDITFVRPAPGMLLNYSSMPARQFVVNPAAEMKDSVQMFISNIGNDTAICRYRFSVFDNSGGSVYDYDGGNFNLKPYFVSGYQNHPPHAWPKFANFSFPVGGDSIAFTITHWLERVGTTQEFNKHNDTVIGEQRFYNYYAYDDGTAEAGYGLSPKGSMLAYRFRLNSPDTLRGAQIFFNTVLNGANQKNFTLVAWADNNGVPGSVIYKNSRYLKPEYSDSLDKFGYYLFDSESPVLLDADHLTFYIGWIQQSDDNLNVGWDMNNDASGNILYNTEGSWDMTSFTGSLMIRPMLGPEVDPTGKKTSGPEGNRIVAFPNPTSGQFHIELPPLPTVAGVSQEFALSVYTFTGDKLITLPYRSTFDLGWLRPGAYLLRLHTLDHYLNYHGKLVITK